MNSFIRITIALAILTLVDSTDAKKSLVTSKETRSLCSNSCHNKIPSLCGSDGKTYYGLCELLRARCRSNKTIKIVKFGKCPTCQLNKPVQCLVPACFRPICPAYPKAICVSFCPCQSEYYYQGRKVNCYRNTTTSNQTNPCDLKFCGPSNKCKVVNGKAVCVSRGAVCSLPKVVGPCKAMFLQFYFNSTTQKCEQFYYGGCRGNRNNFKTKELCESACKPDEDPCSLPPVQGPCEARIPRYFHNITSSKCEKFYYGGCGGNKNNFKNIKECEKNCKRAGSPCDLVFCGVNGRCEVVNGRPVCKRAGSPCDLVFCGVNGKCKVVNGKPVCISSGSAVCSLPKVVGPCRARFLRFYFNSKTQKCELFFYGGCRGNGNNFRTRELCENICKPNEDPCSLPPVQGPCKAHIPRYFHNITSSKCEKFYFGGCRGNKNNFINIKECEKNCKRAGSPCDLVFCGISGKCKVVNGKPVCISSDPCANVSCDAGMKCRVILGKAICRPVLSNPCIATLCRVGTRCVVVNGEGRCIPIKPLVPVNPLCATVLCPQGTKCIVRNKRPICGNPCSSSRQCNQQGSICSLKYGICQCTKYCLAIYRPVCGSDWRRYSNKCHLDAAACRKKTTIRVVPCHGK